MTNALGALIVLVSTNLHRVDIAPALCEHPGCTSGPHSYQATERYTLVSTTWTNTGESWFGHDTEYEVGDGLIVYHPGKSFELLSVTTNTLAAFTRSIAHPSVYRMHTQPGYPVRHGSRWPADQPPLPTLAPAASLMARRSTTTNLPSTLPMAMPNSRRFTQ